MLCPDDFLNRNLKDHRFLHSKNALNNFRGDLAAVDEVLRDIQFESIRKERIAALASPGDHSHLESAVPGIATTMLEDPPVVAVLPRQWHLERYNVHRADLSIDRDHALDRDGDSGCSLSGAGASTLDTTGKDDEGRHHRPCGVAPRNKIVCSIPYSSPEELLGFLQMSNLGTQKNQDGQSVLQCVTDISGNDGHQALGSAARTPGVEEGGDMTVFYADSIEDEQIQQLLEIKRWRYNLMKKVINITS